MTALSLFCRMRDVVDKLLRHAASAEVSGNNCSKFLHSFVMVQSLYRCLEIQILLQCFLWCFEVILFDSVPHFFCETHIMLFWYSGQGAGIIVQILIILGILWCFPESNETLSYLVPIGFAALWAWGFGTYGYSGLKARSTRSSIEGSPFNVCEGRLSVICWPDSTPIGSEVLSIILEIWKTLLARFTIRERFSILDCTMYSDLDNFYIAKCEKSKDLGFFKHHHASNVSSRAGVLHSLARSLAPAFNGCCLWYRVQLLGFSSCGCKTCCHGLPISPGCCSQSIYASISSDHLECSC